MNPVHKPIHALPMMGITCTASTADQYIRNMRDAGLLRTSFKGLNKRWCITEEDIIEIRKKIMAGEYKPSARWVQAA